MPNQTQKIYLSFFISPKRNKYGFKRTKKMQQIMFQTELAAWIPYENKTNTKGKEGNHGQSIKGTWTALKKTYIYICMCVYINMFVYDIYIYMSNGLNLLHLRKDVAEMVIVFCVSPIVPEGLVFVGMK